MAKPISLKQFEFEYSEFRTTFSDDGDEKVVFISKNGDESHLLIECLDGQLVFHPRWYIKIATTDTSKKYVTNLNFQVD